MRIMITTVEPGRVDQYEGRVDYRAFDDGDLEIRGTVEGGRAISVLYARGKWISVTQEADPGELAPPAAST